MRDEVAETCVVLGCSEPTRSRGYCHKHYEHLRIKGIPEARPQREAGTGTVTEQGYIVLSRYESGRRRLVRQHRFVMEQGLGRPLLPTEIIHHLNGDRSDNRPENLELWVTRGPKGQRVADRVADAVEILARYAPALLAEGAATTPPSQNPLFAA